jgi:hypothetical protein
MVLALAFIGCSNESGSETQTETWNTVTGEYPVLADPAIAPLTVVATQSSLTGEIRITVTGTISDDYSYIKGGSTTSWWDGVYPLVPGTFTPADGVYGALVLDEFFPDDASERVLAVKTTNDAFRYYTDGVGNAANPLEEPVTQNPGSIHIPADTSNPASRWRLYNTYAADSGNYIPDDDYLSILLWSGANPKTITLELQEFPEFDVDADYDVLKTITIDYSAVTFATDVVDDYTKTASASIDNYSNSLTVSSAIRNDVTGVTTITLGGTIADVKEASNTFWDNNYPLVPETFTPAAGNYAAFVFNVFPADAVSRIFALKITNDAFRYYTEGVGNATNPLTKPVTADPGTIYIPQTGTATRWRLYNAGAIPNSDWLSVLLWSGANPKRVEIEIQEFDSYDVNAAYTVLDKIVIDYSNVTITASE